MKVFVSWSKPLSHSIAKAFAEWLPKVIQECRSPYMSSDTEKGEGWFQAITTELQQSKIGVVFITPQNASEEWIYLESGAIYAALEKRLCPVLVDIKKADYDGPLRNIQMTELSDKDDMLKLVRTLNKYCDVPLDEPVLDSTFETFWPNLLDAVGSAMAEHTNVKRPAKRSTDDKVDEILLLVRGLSSAADRSASALGEFEDRDLRNRRRAIAHDRARDAAEFKAVYPGADFAFDPSGKLIGSVVRARRVGDDFEVTVARADPGDETVREIAFPASQLTFSDVPF